MASYELFSIRTIITCGAVVAALAGCPGAETSIARRIKPTPAPPNRVATRVAKLSERKCLGPFPSDLSIPSPPRPLMQSAFDTARGPGQNCVQGWNVRSRRFLQRRTCPEVRIAAPTDPPAGEQRVGAWKSQRGTSGAARDGSI